MDKEILEMIEMLINTELSKVQQFHSRHEAWAVMVEEFEEAETEFEDIKTGIKEDYWDNVKNKTAPEYTIKLLDCLEAAIKCNIKELLQLGAMVMKSKKIENKLK